jgi:pyruvate dehydrogenase E1 component alpha subunit
MALAHEDDLGEAPREDPALGLFRVLRDDGSTDPRTDPRLPADVVRRMYREMKRIRLLDERMITLQRQGRIGFYGACTGQEAAPVAAGLAVSEDDWVFPALRESAIMLVRGFPLPSYIAQVYGNAADLLKGRQMPSHMSARAVHQVSWSSCMGTQLPHAVGAAWAAKLRKDPVVMLGFTGDGATSEPDFHAALNFAQVFRVPAVLVCQNNQLAISVPLRRQTAAATIAVKAHAYGMHGVRADGNDVLAVYAVISDAITRAREGEGPTFVELVTYRVAAHSTSDDPSRYRSQDEVDAWIAKDPILRMRRHLEHLGLHTEEDETRIASEATEDIARAIAEVEPQGPPPPASLFDDVYAEAPWHLVEERDPRRGPA